MFQRFIAIKIRNLSLIDIINDPEYLKWLNMLIAWRHHTFLSKRVDRTKSGERIHFASAMTLSGYIEGTDFHDGASYLEFAEFLMKNGANVDKDLEEVWRRIVFTICVKNTDDHLRNHGFLLTDNGWILSPAFDINPVEKG